MFVGYKYKGYLLLVMVLGQPIRAQKPNHSGVEIGPSQSASVASSAASGVEKAPPGRDLTGIPTHPCQQEEYSVKNFEEALNSKMIKEVKDSIGELPPEIRASYVLAHSSASNQKAKPSAPRAIYFRGNFFAGFNRNTASLEIVQSDPNTGMDHFYEAKKVDGRVQLDTHPQSCAECHERGKLGYKRLNWESYSHGWPGFYGAFADSVEKESTLQEAIKTLINAPEDSPYRYLLDLRKNFGPEGFTRSSGDGREVYGGSMNFRFSLAVMEKQFNFIAHRIVEHKKYRELRSRLVKALTEFRPEPKKILQLVNSVYGDYFDDEDWTPTFHHRGKGMTDESFSPGAGHFAGYFLFALVQSDKTLQPLLRGLDIEENYDGMCLRIIYAKYPFPAEAMAFSK